METVNRILNLLAEVILPRLISGLLLFLLLSPGLAGILVFWSKAQMQPPGASGMLSLIVSRLDSGFQLGLGPFLIRAVLLLLLLMRIAVDWSLPPSARWLHGLVLAFLGLSFGSSLVCSHPFEALLTTLDGYLLLSIGVVVYQAPAQYRAWVPRIICASATLVALLSLADFIAYPSAEPGLRLNGTFHQCNMTATYMACCLPWMLQQGLLKPGPAPYRGLWCLASSLCLLALLLTSTRAAWGVTILVLGFQWWFPKTGEVHRWWALPRALVMAALVSVCYILMSKHPLFAVPTLCLLGAGLARQRSALQSLVLVALVLALTAGLRQFLPTSSGATPVARTADIVEGTDFSTMARLEFWRGCLLMARDHPWLGVGPRGFHRYYPAYQHDQRWFSKFAHSSPLTVLAELGIPGIGLLVAFLGLSSWQAWTAYRTQSDEVAGRIRDGFCSAGALGLCSLFDVQWQFPLLPITWAAWLSYSLCEGWPQPDPPRPEEPEEQIGTWTLRPYVVLGYCRFGLFGLLTLANLLWACAHYNFEVSELALQHRRYKDAVELDRIAVGLNPFQASYFHHLGLSLLAARSQLAEQPPKPAELLRVAERAVTLDSHRAVHYDLLGKARLANNDRPGAYQAYAKALECDSMNYPSFYSSLADALDWDKEPQRPRDILELCVRRFPPESQNAMFSFRSSDIDRQMSSVYLSLAESHDPVHHPERAMPYYDKWLKMHPQDINARFGRTVCLLNLNRGKEALQEAQAIYKLDQGEAVRDLLGQVYMVEGLPLNTLPFQWTPPQSRR